MRSAALPASAVLVARRRCRRASRPTPTDARRRVLRDARPPGAGRELRVVPRPRQAARRAAARHQGRPAQGRRRRPGRRRRRPGQERPRPRRPPGRRLTRCRRRPGRSSRPRRSRRSTAWVKMGAPWPDGPAVAAKDLSIDEARRRHWSFQPVKKPAVPTVKDPAWVKNPIDAFVLAKLEEKGLAPSAGRPAHADPPRLLRPDRPAADAGRSRGVRRRPVAGRLREAGRPPAGVAALRRALGPPLARRRPLCRHQGLRLHRGAPLSLLLHLPRLRHPRLQRGPALRPVHRAAARRRPAAARRRQAAAGGAGLPDARPPLPQQPAGHHRRPHRRDHARLPGLTVGCARCHDHKFDPDPDARIITRFTACSPARSSRRSCR